MVTSFFTVQNFLTLLPHASPIWILTLFSQPPLSHLFASLILSPHDLPYSLLIIFSLPCELLLCYFITIICILVHSFTQFRTFLYKPQQTYRSPGSHKEKLSFHLSPLILIRVQIILYTEDCGRIICRNVDTCRSKYTASHSIYMAVLCCICWLNFCELYRLISLCTHSNTVIPRLTSYRANEFFG